jgi:hypothetical protein
VAAPLELESTRQVIQEQHLLVVVAVVQVIEISPTKVRRLLPHPRRVPVVPVLLSFVMHCQHARLHHKVQVASQFYLSQLQRPVVGVFRLVSQRLMF